MNTKSKFATHIYSLRDPAERLLKAIDSAQAARAAILQAIDRHDEEGKPDVGLLTALASVNRLQYRLIGLADSIPGLGVSRSLVLTTRTFDGDQPEKNHPSER